MRRPSAAARAFIFPASSVQTTVTTEPILAMRSVFGAALAKFLFLFAFLYGGFGVHSPFFPSFLSARGLEAEAIGFVLATGTAIRLVAAPVAGQIADRFEASRTVLALSLSAAALVALGYLTAWGFWPLLLMGLVSAAALAPLAPWPMRWRSGRRNGSTQPGAAHS